MTSAHLPDGSKLVPAFRAQPGAALRRPVDLDAILHALRGSKHDVFFMGDLRRMFDSLGGPPPDDEELFRKAAHAVLAGRLAWESPAPLVIGSGGGGGGGSGGSSPPPESQSSPPPKSAPPPSSQPTSSPPPKPTSPSPKPPPPTAPKPPTTGPKPSPPPVPSKPSVSVTAGVSIQPPAVPPPPVPPPPPLPPLKCPHQWVFDTRTNFSPDQTIQKNNALIARFSHKKSMKRTLEGYAFENRAIDQNRVPMQIKRTSEQYDCSLCKAHQEVDISGEHRVAEAKSRNYKSTKDCKAQAQRLLSLQKHLYPSSTLPPLAKLDKSHPEVDKCEAWWKKRGFDVERV